MDEKDFISFCEILSGTDNTEEIESQKESFTSAPNFQQLALRFLNDEFSFDNEQKNNAIKTGIYRILFSINRKITLIHFKDTVLHFPLLYRSIIFQKQSKQSTTPSGPKYKRKFTF